jgi:hypothetical protein
MNDSIIPMQQNFTETGTIRTRMLAHMIRPLHLWTILDPFLDQMDIDMVILYRENV